MRKAIFETVLDARRNKIPVAVVTRIEDGAQALVYRDRTDGQLALTPSQVEAARERMRDDKSATIENGSLFVHVHNPARRLVIIGAVHIAQSLAPMASIAGYEVLVVDPRASFLTEDRFPGVTLVDDWPDEAMEKIAPDSHTAVVTLTHDPKLDDPALHVALRSEAFYIACLGSTRTHAKRVDRLKAEGFEEATIARIHGPAGLPIGAVSPAEIALSVLAQLTAVKHGKPPRLQAVA
jgi:xanthine dehydrogenase accessory factor